jgi:hypothetical protein
MEVKITGDKHNFNYEIKGNKTGISIALKKFSDLMRTVHSDTYKLDAFGRQFQTTIFQLLYCFIFGIFCFL